MDQQAESSAKAEAKKKQLPSGFRAPSGDQDGVDELSLCGCDACRTRKLKCKRAIPLAEPAQGVQSVPCDNCEKWGLQCEYLYQRRRRGPYNKVVKRLADEQAARANPPAPQAPAQQSQQSSLPQPQTHAGPSFTTHAEPNGAPMGLQFHPTSQSSNSNPMNLDHISNYYPPLHSSNNHTLERQVSHGNASSHHTSSVSPQDLNLQNQAQAQNQSNLRGGPYAHPSSIGKSGYVHQNGQSQTYSTSTNSHLGAGPPHHSGDGGFSISPNSTSTDGPQEDRHRVGSVASVFDHRKDHGWAPARVEDVMPRDTALHILSLYFDFVWPLIPCLHRPTFMADLAMGCDERDPMFFAVLMTVLAVTLVHVPKSYIPIPPENVRELAARCYVASQGITKREISKPGVDLVIIKYFELVYHVFHGNAVLECSALGEAVYLAMHLNLHREESYVGLDPVDAERRRRIFFLIYNADKYSGALQARPVLLRSDEFVGPESVNQPAEVDDEYITRNGFIHSSAHGTPVLKGFNVLTDIKTILGDILVHERDARRRPPETPEDVLAALTKVRHLANKIQDIVIGLPPSLQLNPHGNQFPVPPTGWEANARDQLDLFFSDPIWAREHARDAFLVVKGNVHVTLALTKLRLFLHREDILRRSGPLGSPARNAAELVASGTADWGQAVYRDLFNTVHTIPIQALAANGPSLVAKIRAVAATLLEAPSGLPNADAGLQNVASYLWDFVTIMTDIEQQFAD